MRLQKVTLPTTLGSPALGKYKHDAYVATGVEALYDLDRHRSWPKSGGVGGTSPEPLDEDTLVDLSWNGNDATVNIEDSETENIVMGGGGFDFSEFESESLDGEVSFPAAIMTQLAADAAGERSFLGFAYVKLPTEANWADGTSNPSNYDKAFFGLGLTTASGPTDAAVTWHIAQRNDRLRARVQVDGGNINLDITFAELTTAGAFGAVCQLAVYVTPSGKFFRLKTAAGEVSKSNADATWNASFAARESIFGASSGSDRISESETEGLRLYRVGFENLKTSGRTPTTILDADWTRTVARGVFS